MTVLERIAGLWFAVLDASAQSAAALTARVSTRQRIAAVPGAERELLLYPEGRVAGPVLGRIVPPAPGVPPAPLRLLRRASVTLDLDPDRFVVRAVDLPGQATAYIEPILRTQIDRLTPWQADQVVFGWTEPVARAGESGITVTVAATDKALVAPLVQRIIDRGAALVVAQVRLADGRGVVVARATAAAFAVASWRRVLGLTTATVVVLVIGSSLLGQWATMALTGTADDLARQAAEARARIAGAAAGRDPAAGARHIVDQRKADGPFATLALEAVSRLLPDDSFVTSFEITGSRLRLVGFTSDAPALIRLIDGSGVLTGASFFAPTTRLPEDPGDRFSIEATLRPGAGLP